MLPIVYPQFQFKIKEENNIEVIFDEVRKKWVRLTPEEWVRQNFIQYLLQTKRYPASIIAVEKEIKLGDLKKRCDIVVYREDKPWMIVECKEQAVALNDSVIQQILRYNITLDVSILVITNGENSHAVIVNKNGMQALDILPDWNT
ncbi:MAG TPA: type I restriction enzyme HsdR N-terminal domain-containing protein [Panacibacter sp.]|nr:type I restriction enzyme HsdR N-terminal domain-containing protein [Panacibacter sp.]